jgi:hypothetical protein
MRKNDSSMVVIAAVGVAAYFVYTKTDLVKKLINVAAATTNNTVAGVLDGVKAGTVTSGAPGEKGWNYGNA